MVSVGSVLGAPATYLIKLVRQADTLIALQREAIDQQDKMIVHQREAVTALRRLCRAVEGADGGDGS